MTERSTGDLAGQRLGDFEVLRLLGEGGMGAVYEARQASLGRLVALKTLRKEWAADPTYLERFRAEAMAVAPIHHPNIVGVIAIGCELGIHYIAMELVDGRNLREHLKRVGGLEEREALSICKKVAAALERAHEAGVVHRDIKPENILLTRKVGNRPSEVKVADFGLARRLDPQALQLTQSGMTMGTPLYMSPEQARGLPADARSDVYSLGVTAYCMLAGEPPYTGDTPVAVAIQHLQGNARPLGELRPDIAPEFAALVHRTMAVRPEDRPASASALLAELQRIKPRMGAAVPPTAVTAPLPTAAPAATLPAMSAPSVSGGQRLSESLQRLAAAADDRQRRKWTLPVGALAAAALGAGIAWPLRQADPFATPGAAALRPTIDMLPEVESPNAADVLADARKAQGVARERALWLIVETFANDAGGDEVLDAGLDLMRGYFAASDYPRARELAQALNPKGGSHPTECRLLGILCRHLADIRSGKLAGSEAEKALRHALTAPKDPPKPEEPMLAGDPARLKALAAEYFAVLPRATGGDAAKQAELADAFWTRFRSKPKPKPPAIK